MLYAFVLCPSRELQKYIGNKMLNDFTSNKALLNNKKELVSLPYDFCMVFEENYFSRYIL